CRFGLVPPLFTLNNGEIGLLFPETLTWAVGAALITGSMSAPATTTFAALPVCHTLSGAELTTWKTASAWRRFETKIVGLKLVARRAPNVFGVRSATTNRAASPAALLLRWSWSIATTLGVYEPAAR